MNVGVAIAVMLVVGYVPAWALTRSKLVATVGAGAPAVAIAGVGGIVCVLLRVPVLPCTLGVAVVVNAVAMVVLRRRPNDTDCPSWHGGLGLFAFGLSVVTLCWDPSPPLEWDARSIWWFRASWFEEGGDVVVDSIRDPIMTFGHPEYPPGVPSLIGSLWAVTGGEDLRLAMAIGAVLTAAALAMLIAVTFPMSRATPEAMVVPVLLVPAIAMLGQGLGAAGYLDVPCGCLVATAFVCFVTSAAPTAVSWGLGAVAMSAASLTKVEGLFFSVLLAVLTLVWVQARWRFAAVVAAALVPAFVWLVTVRLLNPDLYTDVRPRGFVDLLLLDSDRWSRLWDAWPGVFDRMWPFLLSAGVMTAATLLVRPAESARSVRLAVACLAAAGPTTLGMIVVYAAGVPEVDYWIDTSVDRVAVTPQTFSILAVGVWVDALWSWSTERVHARTRDDLLAVEPD